MPSSASAHATDSTQTTSPADVTSRHCVPLDGVRGLAVLLVLAYDCLKVPYDGYPWTLAIRKLSAAGWIGVDLFFVLSGFLITGVLLQTRGCPGYFRSFMLRRAVRIFPLYYATLLMVYVVLPVLLFRVAPSSHLAQTLGDLQRDQNWFWCYMQNWLFAIRGSWPSDRVLNHFWSLAIEEQFYLVWPLVVAICSRRQLGRLCGVLIVGAFTLRTVCQTSGVSPTATYVMTFTRLDGLAAGALLAIALQNRTWTSHVRRWAPRVLIAISPLIVLADWRWSLFKTESFLAYTVGHSAVALLFAALIGTATTCHDRHPIARLFSLRLFTALGLYSYAIYVCHRWVYAGVKQWDWSSLPTPIQGYAIFGATLALSTLAAAVSWRCLESPFLRLKKWIPRPSHSEAGNLPQDDKATSATPLLDAAESTGISGSERGKQLDHEEKPSRESEPILAGGR